MKSDHETAVVERNVKEKVLGGLAVSTAASTGTSVGRELRALILDRKEAREQRAQGLPEPEKRIYFQTLGGEGVMTTSLVAFLVALRAERRRLLWAFLVGLFLTLLVGDRFDRLLLPARRAPAAEA